MLKGLLDEQAIPVYTCTFMKLTWTEDPSPLANITSYAAERRSSTWLRFGTSGHRRVIDMGTLNDLQTKDDLLLFHRQPRVQPSIYAKDCCALRPPRTKTIMLDDQSNMEKSFFDRTGKVPTHSRVYLHVQVQVLPCQCCRLPAK